MPLLDQIQKDMVSAMKAREEARLGALRMIKAALQKHQIDSMKPLDEQTELQVLNTLVKQRREAADMFRQGDRFELADREEAEDAPREPGLRGHRPEITGRGSSQAKGPNGLTMIADADGIRVQISPAP